MQIRANFLVPRQWKISGITLIHLLAGCAFTLPNEPKPLAPSLTIPSPVAVETVDIGHDQKFSRWLAELGTSARLTGIDDRTIQSALGSVRFIPHIIELDRAQPEFNRAVWDYLDSALTSKRIARGQDQMMQWRSLVDPISVRYGVPTEMLFAFWGVESNFGSDVGDIPTIDALATLGFEGRRADWARGELIAALKILQNHDIDRTQMVGSWAGAMGQTQFMPSIFLAYAVDGDGDGRRDLWGSVADVMASTANFVASSGWKRGEPWGVEVHLPSKFDYSRADLTIRQSTATWMDEGVRSVDGMPMPAFTDSSILLPAGAPGPAFLVGPNFHTILRYNNSTSYALAVGLLAQRLIGGASVQTPWPRNLRTLTRNQLLALQTTLNSRGFDCGVPDGKLGPATQRGVRQYQRSQGLPEDGFPTLDLVLRLK